jgi:hypothetical protein
VLHPHCAAPQYTEVAELDSLIAGKRGYSYTPIHNAYYKDTFISIYGETIEYGAGVAVTEKTFDPLIKGHFILPFSNSGFIQHLQTLGFKFPKFINYEYDSISDDDQRYQAYETELKRLLSISLVDWQQLWEEHIDIVRYNQQLFYTKPYDRVDLVQLIQNL